MRIDRLRFQICDISDYRSELMGWSILWIMMLHFTFTQIDPLGFIAQYGFAGVDIFMLVSGYGLFFSLDRDKNIINFYRKRFIRVFPTYYLLGIIPSILIHHDSFLIYLWRYTTLGYWIGGIYGDWFIPAIIFLYIVAPFIKNLFDKRRIVLITIISIVLLLLSYYFIDKGDIIDRSHFFLLYRIPAFIFGMYCAYCQRAKSSLTTYLVLLIVGVFLFAPLFPHHHEVYNYKYFSLVFLLPTTTYLFITLSKYLKTLNYPLKKMGESSLEIYLIQSNFFFLTTHGYIPNNAWHDTITIGFILISTLLGILAHRIINNGIKFIRCHLKHH